MAYAFANPITGAQGALIRPAIKSPNYAAGVSGWQIAKSGSAEFNNGVFRGIVAVIGINGAEVDISTNDILAIALLQLHPSIDAGTTYDPARIFADHNVGHQPFLELDSPNYVGVAPATIQLLGKKTVAPAARSLIALGAEDIVCDASSEFYIPSLHVGGSQRVCTSEIALTTISSVDSTTSATYVNFAGTSSVTLVKGYSDTKIAIDAKSSFYVTGTPAMAVLGVNINGVDYDITSLYPAIGSRNNLVGFADVAAGLAAGTYTIQLRWKRTAGTGTLNRDANDMISMRVREIA